MKPLLAHIYEPRLVTFPAYVQPKFNGVRALYQNGRFQSRDELPWHPAVLAHLATPLLRMFPPETILDGELYVHGWQLQRINGAISIARSAPIPDTLEVQYIVYDSIDFNRSFVNRFGSVASIINQINDPGIKAATTVLARSAREVDDFYSRLVAEGFEGIMYRLAECPYTLPKQQTSPLLTPQTTRARALSDKDNRAWHLIKRKAWQDAEFTCVAVEEGEGKREGAVGAFVCSVPGLDPRNDELFRVGSGLTDAEALAYFINPPIGRKIKVKFLTYTNRGVPFNPTIEEVL